MANELQKKPQTIKELLNTYKKEIEASIPKHLDADRLLRIALNCIRKVPKLKECNTLSLLGAVIKCAQYGLEPGELIYLIPFKNEVQVIIDYKGLIDLMYRHPRVSKVFVTAVYEGDLFEYQYGTEEYLKHVPATNGNRTKESMLGAYIIASIDGGKEKLFKFMSKSEIEESRMCSIKGRNGTGPWATNYEAMALKTVIRRNAKWIPSSRELINAIALEENEDQKNSEVMLDVTGDDTLALPPPQENTLSKSDQVVKQIKAEKEKIQTANDGSSPDVPEGLDNKIEDFQP